MKIHQVGYFLSACETFSFARAAQKCGISQRSLARALGALEKEFGGYLFHRERSKVSLTELGSIVRPYLQEVWHQTFAAEKYAKDAAKGPSELNLAIMCTIAPKLLIDMLGRLRTSHPEINLRLVEGAADRLEEQLMGSQIEAAIYSQPGRDPDPSLNLLPLFREQMMVVLATGHRLSTRSSLGIKDLIGEPYVQRSFCEFNGLVDRAFEEQTVYSSDRDDWALAMIASGFGFGFFPRHSIAHVGVVAIPLVAPEVWREVNIATVKGRSHSYAVGALIHEAMKAAWAADLPLAVKKHPSPPTRV